MATALTTCSEHKKKQNRYCNTCKLFYCADCRYFHRLHDKPDLPFTDEKLRENVKEEKSVKKAFTKLRDCIDYLGDHHNDIKKEMIQLEKLFKSRFKLQYTSPKVKIRIGSWNLRNVCSYLAQDCIKRTIDKAKLSIVALQEIGENGNTMNKVLKLLQDKNPLWSTLEHTCNTNRTCRCTLKHTCRKNRTCWSTLKHTCRKNQKLGFIWDNTHCTLIHSQSLCTEAHQYRFAYDPLLVVFEINGLYIALINIHLRPRSCPERCKENGAEVLNLWNLLTWAQSICHGKGYEVPHNNFLLIGDFNIIPSSPELASHGYKNIFGITEHTNVRNTETYDNIIVHARFEQRCIQHKVIREDIVTMGKYSEKKRHLTPTERKDISDHCPIYAEFYF